MKLNHAELDVDFIGGKESLTKEDEKAISEFIKANKVQRSKAKEKSVKTKSGPAKRNRRAVKAV
jgi:hypothetical protein